MLYLEIYPIENCADKISEKLDAVLEAKPTMYAKTKDRYRALAYSLLQSVEKISSILEEESLISDDNTQDEFDELSSNNSSAILPDLNQAVNNVRDQIKSYTKFTSSTSSSNSVNNQITHSTKLSNKTVLSTFARILTEGGKHEFKCKQATECAQVISKWFRTRFTSDNRNPKFKYSIQQIPEWISYIIILYGKYHSTDETYRFVEMFNAWCADVSANPSNVWAVPYEVYSLMKSDKPEDFTLDSVIISDILMDEKYHMLTESYFTDSHVLLSCSPVASIVKHRNASLVPKIRTRIAKQSELIQECNLELARGELDDT